MVRAIVGVCAVVVVASLLTFPVGAAGPVQSYGAEKPIDHGTVVTLTGKDANLVAPASQKDVQNMFGVVVNPRQLPVRVGSGALKNETYVAVSGTYNVLVSDQAGAIAAGDYLTLSSVTGVAMKAGTEEPTVLGRAAGAFDGTGRLLGETALKDVDGNTTKTVKLGSIPVTIDIKSNPNDISTKADVPEMLQRVGQAIAEKEVSPIRIYLSMAITAVSLIATIAVLYSGVRNGIISIGRNPMSKKSISRALLETILTSFLILIIGLFAVYLPLRL